MSDHLCGFFVLFFFVICLISGLGFHGKVAHRRRGVMMFFRLLILYVLNNVCSKKININLCADFVPSRALVCAYASVCSGAQCVFCFWIRPRLQPHYLSVSLYVLIYFNSSLLAERWVPPLCQLLCESRSL